MFIEIQGDIINLDNVLKIKKDYYEKKDPEIKIFRIVLISGSGEFMFYEFNTKEECDDIMKKLKEYFIDTQVYIFL